MKSFVHRNKRQKSARAIGFPCTFCVPKPHLLSSGFLEYIALSNETVAAAAEVRPLAESGLEAMPHRELQLQSLTKKLRRCMHGFCEVKFIWIQPVG